VTGKGALSSIPVVGRILGRTAQTAKTAEEAVVAASNTAKIGEELAVASKTIGPITESMVPTLKTALKNGKILVDTSSFGAVERASKFKRILTDIGLQEVVAELHQQDDRSVAAMTHRLFNSMLFGTVLGVNAPKQNVRGYLNMASTSLGLSLMTGMNFEEALVNSAVMTGLHGMGYKDAKKMEGLLKERTAIINRAADFEAESYLSKLGAMPDPGEFSGYKPSEQFRNMTPDERINVRAKAITKLNDMIDNQITLDQNGKPLKAVSTGIVSLIFMAAADASTADFARTA